MEYLKNLLTAIETYFNSNEYLRNMESWNNLSGIIESITTTIAIVIAGIWTYLLFVRQRLNFPKVNIELIAEDKLIPDCYRLVHAKVSINNVGSVMLRSNFAELRIRQVLPLPVDIMTIVNEGKDPVIEGKTEIEWPMLCVREWKWKKGSFEIEPGESDSFHADYIIDKNVEVIEFYCFISNAKKKRSNLGWTITQIHKFHSEGETMADKKQEKSGVNNQQERQQKQQEQQKPQKPSKPETTEQKKSKGASRRTYNVVAARCSLII